MSDGTIEDFIAGLYLMGIIAIAALFVVYLYCKWRERRRRNREGAAWRAYLRGFDA